MTIIDDWWVTALAEPEVEPPDPPDDPTTTDEWWEVDGVVLNTLAFNIATIDGTEQLPPMRGENVLVGNRPGRRHIPKVPDERIISLGMWVVGADVYGDASADQRATFRTNWEALKALFGQPGRQMVVTRRYRLLDGIHTRSALVEIAGPMELSARGHTAGAFVVDLKMADPFWYGPVQQAIADRSTSTRGGFDFPLDFPLLFDVEVIVEYGTIDTTIDYTGVYKTHPFIRLDGPVENPYIWHVQSDSTLALDIELTEGEWLEFDFENSRITLNGTTSVYNLLTNGSSWFFLDRGENTIQFGGDAGQGILTIVYRPNYW